MKKTSIDTELIDSLNEEAWKLRETDMNKAYQLSKKAFALSKAKNYAKGLAQSQRTVGLTALSIGNYAEAYEMALAASVLFRESGEKVNEAVMQNILGGIYDYLGDYDNRLKANLRSLQLRKEGGDEEGYVRSLNNTGDTYIKLGQYDKALELFYKGLAFIENRPRLEAILLCNIGEVYMLTGKMEEAEKTISKSVEVGKKVAYHAIVAADLIMLARIQISRRQPTLASLLLNEALAIAETHQLKADLAEVHKLFSETNEQLGSFNLAHQHYKKFHDLKEEIINEKKILEMRNIQFNHESENLQKAAQLLEMKVEERTRQLNEAYNDLQKIEEEQRTNLEIEKTVNYFSSSLFYKNTVDEVVWDLAKKCISRLNFVDCVIYLKDETGTRLIQRAAYGIKNPRDHEIYNPIEIPVGKGIVGSVAASGKPEIISDTSQDPRYILDDEIRLSEITIPILSGSEVIGVIDSEHPEKGFFNEKHQRILTTIASLCANKIEKIRLDETRTRLGNELIEQLKKNEQLQTQVNRELEQKVKERTHEIEQKKLQIELQKKDITDSISYASTIQQALLPPANEFMRLAPESFILYKPKDIISGDFYWIAEKESTLLVALADCTGHGVPGALMSAMSIAKLEQASETTSDPGELLNLLNDQVRKALRQENHLSSTSNDGLDIALISYNRLSGELKFAGANRPLLTVAGGEANEHKAQRQSIGGRMAGPAKFRSVTVPLPAGSRLYLFSDGFTDQFGGEKNKKLGKARLKAELTKLSATPLQDQKIYLESMLNTWKGDQEQTDDIALLGISF